MARHHPLFHYLLLLMLAAGPVQGQTVLLCDMMEVPRQETCCCDEMAEGARAAEPGKKKCYRPPCPAAPRADADGCCASAVEVSYEPDAGPVVTKPPFDRTDTTPSIPILTVYDLPVPPGPTDRAPDSRPAAAVIPDGSNLYLRTERLRI